jgi:prepilin signal peptidase PulO-like enzyme (type II secretory pathway)
MLALYDTQWHLLPDKILFPTIAITAAGVILGNIFLHSDMIPKIPDALMGVVIVCGFFGLLYFISKGKWIGFGDVKLGILIGLVLGAEKGALALVLSYYLGAIFVMPLLLKHKLKTSSVIPFGPFLLAAFFISFLFGPHIINWYKDLLEIKTTTS